MPDATDRLAQTATPEVQQPAGDPAKVVELLRGERVAMITTVAANGTLQSRPMAIQQVEDDGDLWFFIAFSSEQAVAVTADPRVNVAVTSGSTWTSVAGLGQVVRDSAKVKELWNPWAQAWFTDGPSDPEVALLHVDAQSAEYWDTPGGHVASIISFVKAKVTGETYSAENATVDLSSTPDV